MSGGENRVYRYYLPFRPPDLGAVPRGTVQVGYYDGRPYNCQIRRSCYGHADYARPLTEQEIRDYEIVPDPRNPIVPD